MTTATPPRPGTDQQPTTGTQSRADGSLLKLALAVLGGIAAVLALAIIATVATNAAQAPAPKTSAPIIRLSGAVPVVPVVYLSVSPGVKPGPDGQLHDAFSQTTFYVHAGKPIKLVINNTDNVPHSITSSAAGVNIVARPGKHTYTLLVTHKGEFQWHCAYPCDPYSMSHLGYMMGTIVSD